MVNDQVISAIFFALSFALARRVHWRWFHSEMFDKSSAIIFGQPSLSGEFYRPVELITKDAPVLMTKLLEYSLNQNVGVLESFLGALWDLGNSNFKTKQLALGVALEGISKSIFEESDQKNEVFESIQKKLLTYLNQLENTEVLDQFEEKNIKDAFERWGNVIKGSKELSGKRLLEVAGKIIGCEISSKDLTAWSKMRNDSAHGNTPLESVSQPEIDRFFRCVSLLNSMICNVVGYSGSAIDYTSIGWPSKSLTDQLNASEATD